MKNKYNFILMSVIIIMVNRCEDVELALPGNNQDNPSVAPAGTIIWDENNVILEDGKAIFPENSAAGVTIGRLYATDENPDDEFNYQIKSQKVDGTNVNHFTIEKDSESNYDLETNNTVLNYEALGGSKLIIITITVTDDNPDQKTSDFNITIEISNVNESPYFSNLNSIPRKADEYVEYSFDKIEWSDIDEGQNPTMTYSSDLSWLTITSEGQMSGDPVTSDIGTKSFTLTITDGEISVQEEVEIEVRENSAPVFNNTNSIPTLIRVGCYDDNDNLVDINWYDPNNNSSAFAGNDIVTFSHEGTESIDWLNFDNEENGILFCVRAPENGDAGTSTINLHLEDDRPVVALSTDYSFDLTLSANDAPSFSNLGGLPDTLAVGDTLTYDIDWQDPQEDPIDFHVTESLSWLNWESSGDIEATPDSTHVGNHTLVFRIDDGCYDVSVNKTLTVQ